MIKLNLLNGFRTSFRTALVALTTEICLQPCLYPSTYYTRDLSDSMDSCIDVRQVSACPTRAITFHRGGVSFTHGYAQIIFCPFNYISFSLLLFLPYARANTSYNASSFRSISSLAHRSKSQLTVTVLLSGLSSMMLFSAGNLYTLIFFCIPPLLLPFFFFSSFTCIHFS